MNSNQRSQGNNQSSNGGNEKSVSSSRAGTVEKDNINPEVQRSGTLNSSTPVSQQNQAGVHQSERAGQDSTDRTGSQTGNLQKEGGPVHTDNEEVHQSNDAAGGLPRSPGGANQLAADEKMDDDTGFSRGGYRTPSEIDNGSKQEQQSNVGRRSDMTPD